MTLPDGATVRELVRLACRAPSVHNTQPWHWVVTDHEIRLHADTGRQLTYADADGRDLTVSCGAALHQLTVAAAGRGWAAAVDRLPDPAHPLHLATVSFAPHTPDSTDLRTFEAISERRTDRRQVSSWPVPPARLEQLTRIAAHFGVVVTIAPGGDAGLVPRLLQQALAARAADQAYHAELLSWIQPFFHGEGMPTTNLLTSSAGARGDPTRFPPGSLSDPYVDAGGPSPAWLVLSTSSDDRLSWLRVGEAMDAIWLACTVTGLAVVPFSQPIEVAVTRAAVERELLEDASCPQILLRVGWPPVMNKPVPLTPRRPLDEVLNVPETARAMSRSWLRGR
jgi:hypothetical protein